ncbi:nucleotidyltransferase domain-containing protein [Pseudobutyrivibrio sp.]|uniref:nucleotidyltransferase domain-containing protein n=1 Tax=Pseudobutyrivibrio sp. TaxID=2014367 RepID=UPI001D7B7184|nr:nucleotidyltransferase domain-containing protein [Pseudobutyrivibrio sp.]MBE5910820.1 nucleotidyltransferase domain-containing protein [Pseudobutyrivibrio sp.]
MDNSFLKEYVEQILSIYGSHVKKIILYGSYARGDNRPESDIDIMILLDLSDAEVAEYQHELSGITFDYNFDNDLDINPIAQSEAVFNKWVGVYPFFKNVKEEGVVLYGAA